MVNSIRLLSTREARANFRSLELVLATEQILFSGAGTTGTLIRGITTTFNGTRNFQELKNIKLNGKVPIVVMLSWLWLSLQSIKYICITTISRMIFLQEYKAP